MRTRAAPLDVESKNVTVKLLVSRRGPTDVREHARRCVPRRETWLRFHRAPKLVVPTLAVLAIVSWLGTASAIDVEVGPDQTVTLAGESPSLRTVVETLCQRAGIELRGYGAPDREFHGSYHHVAAAGLLPRILREESHVVGLRTDPASGRTRIAWLRVLGPAAETGAVSPARVTSKSVAAPSVLAQMPAQAFEAQKARILDLLQPIFESDPPDRQAKIAEVAKTLSRDDGAREALLGAGQTDIADELAEYPDAVRTLGKVGAAVANADARRHLASITQRVGRAVKQRSYVQ
jgi:hypothetical protein